MDLKSTILFLSSGVRQRYREDVLRALALPSNGRLDVRYMQKYVQPNVWDDFKTESHCAQRGLLAYLDQGESANPPEIVPCRFVEVERCEHEGKFIVVSLRMKGFPVLRGQEEVGGVLRQSFSGLPDWESQGTNRKIKGSFCLASQSTERLFAETNEIEAWQNVVDRIGSRSDFEQERFFPYVAGIFLRTSRGMVSVSEKGGEYSVKSGASVEIKVGHFHPKRPTSDDKNRGWIVCCTDGPLMVTRNRYVQADSPYSVNYVRLMAQNIRVDESGAFSLFLNRDSEGRPRVDDSTHLIDIPIKVKARHFHNLGIALLIGLLLWGQNAVQVLTGDVAVDWRNLAAVFIVAFAAALVAVYALRKPF